MNKLTTELINQSTTREMVGEGLGGYYEDELDPNKLIEFVTRECISLIQDNGHLFHTNDYKNILIGHIKTKFGLTT